MRLSCDVELVNRLLPSHGVKGKGRPVRCSLVIGRRGGDRSGQEGAVFLMVCSAKDKVGTKYKVSLPGCRGASESLERARCILNVVLRTEHVPSGWAVLVLNALALTNIQNDNRKRSRICPDKNRHCSGWNIHFVKAVLMQICIKEVIFISRRRFPAKMLCCVHSVYSCIQHTICRIRVLCVQSLLHARSCTLQSMQNVCVN